MLQHQLLLTPLASVPSVAGTWSISMITWMSCCWASLSVLTEGCCHDGPQASVWRSTRRLRSACRWLTVQVCCQTTGLDFLKGILPRNPSSTGIWPAGPSDLQSPSGREALSGAKFPCQLDTPCWRIMSNIHTSFLISTTRVQNWHSQWVQLFYTVVFFFFYKFISISNFQIQKLSLVFCTVSSEWASVCFSRRRHKVQQSRVQCSEWFGESRGRRLFLKARKDLKVSVSLQSTTGFGKGCFLLFPEMNSNSHCVSTQICLTWAPISVTLMEEKASCSTVSSAVMEITLMITEVKYFYNCTIHNLQQ